MKCLTYGVMEHFYTVPETPSVYASHADAVHMAFHNVAIAVEIPYYLLNNKSLKSI